MTQTLSEFIASTRLADSIEHEKFIISSEQADIRSYIRECDPQLRPRIVAKLIFLSTIGENVAYGQMEVLTLMSQEQLSYKRIGYLAASVILDESSELTVLITHTILKDLQNTANCRIQCLALSLLANLGSAEMCQAVSTEVQKIISQATSTNHITPPKSHDQKTKSFDIHPLLLKTAAMASVRIIEKVPELAENFKQSVQKLLKHGSHGVVIAGINLMSHIIRYDPNLIQSFQRYIPAFTKILGQLSHSRPSNEFSFNIFNDPFLQIRLLQIIAKLDRSSDELDDVLEMITTSSDFRRNTGRSILFQAVETIVAVAKKPSLRGLAFSQVGRLFQFKESNVLYSALSLFSRVLYQGNEIVGRTSGDSIALQRYKTQVVRCLNHRDPSIRRRAMDVVSALVDEKNVESLVPEVLDYVRLADKEFRVDLVAKIYTAIQRFSPTLQWNFNIVHRLLIENGRYVSNDMITSFCRMISQHQELQEHAVALLQGSILEESDNQSLTQVASYVIGEFMHNHNSDQSIQNECLQTFNTMKKIVQMPQTLPMTKGYLITSISKIAARFGWIEDAKSFMESLCSSNSIDVQQRAGEMARLMSETEIIDDILAPLAKVSEKGLITKIAPNSANNKKEDEDEDLLIDISSVSSKNAIENLSAVAANLQTTNPNSDLNDLLSLDVASKTVQQQPQEDKKIEIKPPQGAIEGLRKPDYVLYFEIRKNPANQKQVAIRVSVFNLGKVPLNNFQIKYGVPVGWYLQSQPATSKELEPIGNSPIFQQLMVATQTETPLMMKVQISYLYGSQPITEVDEIKPIFG